MDNFGPDLLQFCLQLSDFNHLSAFPSNLQTINHQGTN